MMSLTRNAIINAAKINATSSPPRKTCAAVKAVMANAPNGQFARRRLRFAVTNKGIAERTKSPHLTTGSRFSETQETTMLNRITLIAIHAHHAHELHMASSMAGTVE